jgi:hypothetical protein
LVRHSNYSNISFKKHKAVAVVVDVLLPKVLVQVVIGVPTLLQRNLEPLEKFMFQIKQLLGNRTLLHIEAGQCVHRRIPRTLRRLEHRHRHFDWLPAGRVEGLVLLLPHQLIDIPEIMSSYVIVVDYFKILRMLVVLPPPGLLLLGTVVLDIGPQHPHLLLQIGYVIEMIEFSQS